MQSANPYVMLSAKHIGGYMFIAGVLFIFGIGFALIALLPIPQIGALWFFLGGIIWVRFEKFVKKNRNEDDI